MFCTFWLRNVLRATAPCNFSSLIWPDGSAPAALASLLFDPPEPQIIGKTQCFATFLPFRASASSFFWLFLFSDLLSSTLLFSLTLPISAFHLSILSEDWLLFEYNCYWPSLKRTCDVNNQAVVSCKLQVIICQRYITVSTCVPLPLGRNSDGISVRDSVCSSGNPVHIVNRKHELSSVQNCISRACSIPSRNYRIIT